MIMLDMAFAIGDLRRFFQFEDLMMRAEDPVVIKSSARMIFRKGMEIFPELNTREPITDNSPIIIPQHSRLIRKFPAAQPITDNPNLSISEKVK